MSSKQGKKCCQKFKVGKCTAENCPFPHVSEALAAAKTKEKKDLREEKNKLIRKKRLQEVNKSSFEKISVEKNSDLAIQKAKDALRSLTITSMMKHGVDRVDICCKACKSDFLMNQSELLWYRENDLHIPKHCRMCREVRKTY